MNSWGGRREKTSVHNLLGFPGWTVCNEIIIKLNLIMIPPSLHWGNQAIKTKRQDSAFEVNEESCSLLEENAAFDGKNSQVLITVTFLPLSVLVVAHRARTVPLTFLDAHSAKPSRRDKTAVSLCQTVRSATRLVHTHSHTHARVSRRLWWVWTHMKGLLSRVCDWGGQKDGFSCCSAGFTHYLQYLTLD